MFNLRIARYIDAYIGTVICLILGLYDALFGIILTRPLAKNTIKTILILNVSEMGSSIPAIPLLSRLKEDNPGAAISFITFEQHCEALKDLNFFKDISFYGICSESLPRFFISTFKLIYFLTTNKFDITVNLEIFTCYSTILTYLSGAKIRIAFAHKGFPGICQNAAYTHTLNINQYAHISENMYALAEFVPIPSVKNYYMKRNTAPLKDIPKATRTQEEKDLFLKKYLKGENKKYIVIHPGFEDLLPLRCWPYKSYYSLIDSLQRLTDVEVILIGKSSNPESFTASDKCIDLINKLTMYEIVTLFHCASVFVTHDCGLAHIAALSDIHTACFFGPETPMLYSPLSDNQKIFFLSYFCSPCFSPYNLRTSMCSDNRCVRDISHETVYQHICNYLGA